jgi:hypothetical protein
MPARTSPRPGDHYSSIFPKRCAVVTFFAIAQGAMGVKG